MKVGIRIPACDRPDRLASVAARAERLGFDEVWFPDSQLLWRDVFSVLSVTALRTERIGLGTAVTNVATRHPSVVASAARTVAELAPGRFTLGLGVGNSSVLPVGMRASTGAEFAAGVAQVRALLAGDEWDYGPVRSRLRDPAPSVPIQVAASGPRNLRLAGAVADGVVLLSGVSPDTLAAAAKQVGEGAREAGRTADVPLTVSAFCEVTDDVAASARKLKPICASIAQNGGAPFLALAGIDVSVPARVDEVYPDLVHAEDWDRAVEVAGRWISDDDALAFADAFCLIGTADEIAARLRETFAAGASGVFLQHVGSYDPPHDLIEAVGGDVLPSLS
ncbi:LLM class flavin-dependent oxidoreductase [Actinomadura syzygii]|uniref:LLM class flavin-dependent oxidoreductase n=1 Tax=Actinomadura syzygii TaxID=1427538 RepID=A0A5D0ULM9_9ACTN|nr:LLM class flavin-dependent oxidoreductase [Actinomadura syzygii]TYC18505.1 LLM class flavin-dependent oxidoreductase [Actinomadura syzygii]